MKVRIVRPLVPNFLRVEIAGVFQTVSIAEMSDEQLDAIAKDWRFGLYENRNSKKAARPNATIASDTRVKSRRP